MSRRHRHLFFPTQKKQLIFFHPRDERCHTYCCIISDGTSRTRDRKGEVFKKRGERMFPFAFDPTCLASQNHCLSQASRIPCAPVGGNFNPVLNLDGIQASCYDPRVPAAFPFLATRSAYAKYVYIHTFKRTCTETGIICYVRDRFENCVTFMFGLMENRILYGTLIDKFG